MANKIRSHCRQLMEWVVYTCQKPQHQKCGFFLWAEAAELREREVLIANSHSETDTRLQTPSKSIKFAGDNGLPTPQTERRTPQTERRFIDITPSKATPKPTSTSTPLSAKARMMAEDTDEFSWDIDSEDDELTEALASTEKAAQSFISQPNFRADYHSPNKAPRTPSTTSPGKRKLSEFDNSISSSGSSLIPTPKSSHSGSFSSHIPPSSAELCMTPTPTRFRGNDVLHSDSRSNESALAREILAILDKHGAVIPNAARDEIVTTANREDAKYRGVVRARDMLRNVNKKKDDEIQLLKEKNTNLRAQTIMDEQTRKSESFSC